MHRAHSEPNKGMRNFLKSDPKVLRINNRKKSETNMAVKITENNHC